MTPDVAARFLQGLGVDDAPPGPVVLGGAALGVAVSGGGDSMALLHLAVQAGLTCRAVTVDHGLRAGSADEAAMVAQVCAGLGVPHEVLRWQGWDGRGNVQDQARRARYALMADWARRHGVAAVALGHNRDDLAETFLMRLARGAGVDGLAAMAARRTHLGVEWRRPLLGIGRADLRAWLAAQGLDWVEDPSNTNDRFARIRVRKAMAGLGAIGITAAGLAQVATHLAEVRQALALQTAAAARTYVQIEAGDVVLSARALDELPAEIGRRLLVHALLWVTSAEYGPRGAALARATTLLRAGRSATLMGCRMLSAKGMLRITREWQSVRDLSVDAMQVWDGRWKACGPDFKGLTVAALGPEGLVRCPDWRKTGVPRASLIAAPAIWQGTRLVAAPLAGMSNGWRIDTIGGSDAFFLSVLSH